MSTMVINKVPTAEAGNFRNGGGFNPGKIRGLIFTPWSIDLLSTAELADPKTNLQAKLVANAYSSRSIFISVVGMMENNGEAEAYENREQFKVRTDDGTWDKLFTMLKSSWSEYQMLLRLHGRGAVYNVSFVDENNVLRHLETSTGICGFRLHALEALMPEEPTSGAAVKYRIRVALADINEIKRASHSQLPFNPFHPLTGLQGVDDVVLADVTSGASAGVFHVSVKGTDRETNLVDVFSAVWNTATAFSLVNKLGATISITSVGILSSGTDKVAFVITANTSDPDYTATDPGYLKMTSISTLSGLGTKYYESNTLTLTLS